MMYAFRLRHCKYELYLKSFEHGELVFSTYPVLFPAYDIQIVQASFPKISFKAIEYCHPLS